MLTRIRSSERSSPIVHRLSSTSCCVRQSGGCFSVLCLNSLTAHRDLSHPPAALGGSLRLRGSRPPPTPLLSIAPLRGCWFAVGVLAPREGRLQQRGLLFVRSGFTPSLCSTGCVHPHSEGFHRGLDRRLLTAVSYDRASCSDASFLHCTRGGLSHAFEFCGSV